MDPAMSEPSSSPHDGPMNYVSSSEGGRTPASIIAIGAVFVALPTLSVALRFYCRLLVTKSRLAADDWLMFLALVFNIAMGLMLIIGAALHGLAQPTPQGWGPQDYFWITDNAEVLTEKIFFAFILTQAFGFALVKLSILYFYRRIFQNRTFRTITTVMMVLICIWGLGFFFGYLFRCGTRFWALWAPLMDLVEYCYDSKPLFYSLAISDVITDVIILSLPFFWVARLNTSVGKRLAVSGVFLLGAIEIATGLARLVVYINQSQNFKENADGIGHLTTLMVWSMIEMSIAVVAGCLPTIWPLVSRISIEQMMHTMRSVLSSGSLRSARSEKAASTSSRREEGDDASGHQEN
ncbi:hypothetical protein GGR50DRAFT_683247 [Xylaria sp. CBS 124048]|nr:hypothetical protein GGR50DRAFT_683247 [Xylaria sp. CBS 124048]